MDVRLPSGKTIRGVPEGTPKDAIMAKAIQAGLATQADFGISEEVAPNVVDSGVDNLPDNLADDSGGLIDSALSVAEPLLTVASGAVAEPLAGLAGVAQTINPFAEEGAGAEAVEATREALTYQPRTEAGQEGLQAVGEALEPVAEVLTGAEEFLGDSTFDFTGSPALAAAAKTIPTAIGEALGIAGIKGGVKAAGAAKKSAAQGKIAREISDAVPSIEQLKDTSRAVYKEIDDMGAVLQPKAFRGLANKLNKSARSMGFDPGITPKSSTALNRFNELVGSEVKLTEVDTLRRVAQNAAKSLEPAESAIGTAMIQNIDDFLDNLGPSGFKRAQGPTSEIGKRYKVARDLWGRARRSELLEESFEKARNQASGFENGIRTQFRAILNNKNKRRMFKPDELAAMNRVVRGDAKENLAKLVGRLGFSEGGATNVLGGAVGAGAGAAIAGAPGAVIVPLVGQVSRKLAQRMTVKNAEFADQVVRAGKDAKKITQAYLRNTPKDQVSSVELSQLLMRPDIDLSDIPEGIASEAADLARRNREAVAGVAATPPIQEGE